MLNLDTRKKIIEAHKAGMSVESICTAYHAGKTAVYRLIRQERECGEILPRTYLRGRKPTISSEQIEQIRQLVLSNPNYKLEEIRDQLHLTIGIASISRILRYKLGFQYRNKQYLPKRQEFTGLK